MTDDYKPEVIEGITISEPKPEELPMNNNEYLQYQIDKLTICVTEITETLKTIFTDKMNKRD